MDGSPELNDGWSGYTEVNGSRLTDAEVAQSEADARETAYLEELAEIETMKKWLKRAYATRQMTLARMEEGLSRLTAKTESVKFRHRGNTIPEYLPPVVQVPEPPTRKPRSGNPNGCPRPTPRKDARRQGEKFYFTGKACPAGHTSKRRVSSGCCIQCAKDWTANNRDKSRVYWRESKRRQYARKKASIEAEFDTICGA